MGGAGNRNLILTTGTTVTGVNTLSALLNLGTGTVTKSGGGTLTLSGSSTYAGGTILNAGTLQASADNNLGSASGTAPGQSGIWVCPGDGCQTSACALAGANARAIQAATIEEQSGTNLGAVTMASRILAARQSAAKQPATTAEAQAWRRRRWVSR